MYASEAQEVGGRSGFARHFGACCCLRRPEPQLEWPGQHLLHVQHGVLEVGWRCEMEI